jgi:O-antigen ligase
LSFTGVGFCLVFLTGCVLAFARHPIWGASLYVSTFFIGPQQHWWGQGVLAEVRWAYIAAVVTLLALLFTRKAKPQAIPLTRHTPFWLMVLFTCWLAIQYLWALDPQKHFVLLDYYVKFTIAMALIYRCVDSEESLKILLWTHFGCCFYLGWLAYSSYEGGRFEDFGGAGLSEANAAALALGSGVMVGAALLLAGKTREKLVVLGGIPFIINGIVTTISRSGSLALVIGGLVFNLFAPRKYARLVKVLSVPAVLLFLMLAGTAYWTRMSTLEQAGETVQGEDTGADRLEIIKAQFRMFKAYPMGCGSNCTAVLSPQYLSAQYLAWAPVGVQRERASHNTFVTMLVEHGVPGAMFYVAMLLWTLKAVWKLARTYRTDTGFMTAVFPGVVAVLGGIVVGDMFVSYARFEIRFWFLALLMAMLSIQARRVSEPVPGPVRGAAGPLPGFAGAHPVRPAAPRVVGGPEMRSGSQ